MSSLAAPTRSRLSVLTSHVGPAAAAPHVPKTHKKLYITAPKVCEWVEEAMPACPADGVLVKTETTCMSIGTELRCYRGIPVDPEGKYLHEWVPFDFPYENGYSTVGRVVQVGAEATGLFDVGDKVCLGTAHAEYTASPAGGVWKVPDGLSDELAVWLFILGVGDQALRRAEEAGTLKYGSTVGIVGLGMVGLSVLAYCNCYGFQSVCVDPDPARRAMATKLGAGLVVDPNALDFRETVQDYCSPDGGASAAKQRAEGEVNLPGPDIVIEGASKWGAIQTSMDLCANNGAVVVVARHYDAPEFNPVGQGYFGKRLQLLTVYGHPPAGDRWDQRRSYSHTLELLQTGQLDIAPLISHRFEASQLEECYSRLDGGEQEIVGAVFQWP
eukprot:SAG22_NODE_4208_length_1345_cov_1.556180_1_plen_385_part_00